MAKRINVLYKYEGLFTLQVLIVILTYRLLPCVKFTESQCFIVLFICIDSAGNLHLGAGTTHCKSGGSEGGVSSHSFSQSSADQIRPGPDNVLSLFPGGESQRYGTTKVSTYLENECE